MASEIILLARRPRAAWRRPVIAGVLALVIPIALLLAVPAQASVGGVSGRVFHDEDRDGAFDPGDGPWDGHAVVVYDAAGQFAGSSVSGADGTWGVEGLPAGSYTVEFADRAWEAIRMDWAPTTFPGVWPTASVAVGAGTVEVDFGWRPITRSTDPSAPTSSITTADGVVIESFTDAVPASALAAHLDSGTLRGGEAATTAIRFGLDTTTRCSSSISGAPGSYTEFSASCSVSYLSWLMHRDRTLFHEYGHAWARYHDTVVQQQGDLASYLEYRGIAGDDRLETSHAWTSSEIIAEDYRQLFGSPVAASYHQENPDIPRATEVPGLKEWLSSTFMAEPTADPSPEPTADPSPEPTADPSPEPTEQGVTLTVIALDVVDGTAPVVEGAVNEPAVVSLRVVGENGKTVRELMTSRTVDSEFAAVWDGRDDRGRAVRPGTYVIMVDATTSDESASASASFSLTDGGTGDTGSKGNGKGRD